MDFEITAAQHDVIENAVQLAVDSALQMAGPNSNLKDISGEQVDLEDKIESLFWGMMELQDLIDTDDPVYFAATKVLFEEIKDRLLFGGEEE